jgi:hypothetical protein
MAHCDFSFESWFDCVHDMHLEIHELSIDGVLRWCVEMVLGTIEDAALTVFFEQTNGRGLHEIVHWRIWTFQKNLDL